MKKLLSLVFLLTGLNLHAQVAVNTDGTAPDNSAMLDVKSTSQGMLVPRMTTAERLAIATRAAGLLVFDNTTNSFWFWGTAAWQEITTGSTGWNVTGNSGTDTTVNFIGTTDNVPLAFRVNNQVAGKIDPVSGNTSLGYQSLVLNTTGINNVALGASALYSNVSEPSIPPLASIRCTTASREASIPGSVHGAFNSQPAITTRPPGLRPFVSTRPAITTPPWDTKPWGG